MTPTQADIRHDVEAGIRFGKHAAYQHPATQDPGEVADDVRAAAGADKSPKHLDAAWLAAYQAQKFRQGVAA